MKHCPCCKAKLFFEDGWAICYACGWEKDLTVSKNILRIAGHLAGHIYTRGSL